MFLFVTALKFAGETTKGLHLALFLFSTPRKNIGKSLKKEKNSAFSKVRARFKTYVVNRVDFKM